MYLVFYICNTVAFMFKRVFLATLFLFLLTKTFGQVRCDYTLTGNVSDIEGSVLVSAVVQVGGKNAVTDTRGNFTIENLCEGKQTITIRYVGYEDYQAVVLIPHSGVFKIVMKTSSTVLQDVVVKGEAAPTTLTNAISSLTTSALELTSGKSLGESLRGIPGVSAIQTGPAIFKPVIHGLHSQRVLILNNGIRQEGQQWGIEHAPEVDPFIASEIRVVKGAETVRYGADAIGGVIILDSPPLHKTQRLGGEINTGFFSNNRMGYFSGMFEGGFSGNDKWSWRLQSSVKKGGDFSAPDYTLSNTGLEELNFSASLGFRESDKGIEIYASSFNTEIGILRAAHTGNLNDLDNSIRNERPWFVEDFSFDINNPKQRINHQLLKVSAYKDVAGLGKITLLYGGQYNQRKEFDIRRGEDSNRPSVFMQLFSNVLDLSLDHAKGDHSGSIGMNVTAKINTNDTEATGVRPLIPDYRQYSGGVFFLEKMRKGNWLFEAGARYDYQFLKAFVFDFEQNLYIPTFHFHYFSGTAGASYYWNDRTRLSSHLGISSRPPHISELYSEGLHHGTATIEEGLMRPNGELITDAAKINKEVSIKWINNFQWSLENFSIDFSVFYNYINNYVYLRPTETRLTIRGYFPVFQYQQTDAVLTGVDANWEWSLSKHFEYSGRASYLYGRDISNDDVLIFMPPAQLEHAVTYRFDTKKVKDIFFSFIVPTGFEQTRAPLTVYPIDVPNYDGDKIFDFAPAPSQFTLLNFETGFKLNMNEQSLTVSMAVENILNEDYRLYMNRLRYFASEPGRNFIIRLKYHFHKHD